MGQMQDKSFQLTTTTKKCLKEAVSLAIKGRKGKVFTRIENFE